MPYGMPKSMGGDSPKNDAKMEKMVSAIEATGQDKVSAIKIAKASLEKKHALEHAGRVSRASTNHKRPR